MLTGRQASQSLKQRHPPTQQTPIAARQRGQFQNTRSAPQFSDEATYIYREMSSYWPGTPYAIDIAGMLVPKSFDSQRTFPGEILK